MLIFPELWGLAVLIDSFIQEVFMGHSLAKNSSRPWGCSIDQAEQIPYGLDILVRRRDDLSFLWAISDGEIKLGRKVGIVSADGRGVQFQTAWWGGRYH